MDPFHHAHFATFPVEIPPQRAIAAELGHPYIGIDINADYLQLSLRTRLDQPTLTAHAAAITTAAP